MNTTAKGDSFELKVHALLQKLLRSEKLHVPGKRSKIYHKKGYYSTDRGREIVFDIAIETYLPGASQYSLLTLIECKNYTSPVPVNDIEEFCMKIDQIGQNNTKAIFIGNNAFQRGALNVARARKIALARVQDKGQLEWILYRKDKADSADLLCTDDRGLTHFFAGEYQNDLVASLPDLLLTLEIIDQWQPDDDFITVPHIKSADIDRIISQLGIERCYWGRHLDMQLLCETISAIYDAEFDLEADLSGGSSSGGLGMICFDPLRVSINRGIQDDNRKRFTLAHEIGHLVLHQSLLRPLYDSRLDTESNMEVGAQFSSRTAFRLEFQANMFASHLLLPKEPLARYMANHFKRNNIHRGFIYVDGQPINQLALFDLLTDISRQFGVSQEVAKLRLKKCNLLKDGSEKSMHDALKESGFM